MRSASSTVRLMFCSTSSTVAPSSPDLGDRLEDLVDELRRQAERRLVEQEQARLGDQRAGDRELLLLAAGQRSRGPAEGLPQDREAVEGAFERRVGARAVAFAVLPSARFSPTVSVAKMCRPSMHQGDSAPRDLLGGQAGERFAEEGDLASRHRHEPDDRRERGRLAGAVRPDEADDLALLDLEAQALDGRRTAVAHREVTDAEHALPRPCRDTP